MLIRLKVILYLTIQYYFPSVDLSPSSGQRRYTTKLILIKIIIDVCINDCYYYLLLLLVVFLQLLMAINCICMHIWTKISFLLLTEGCCFLVIQYYWRDKQYLSFTLSTAKCHRCFRNLNVFFPN